MVIPKRHSSGAKRQPTGTCGQVLGVEVAEPGTAKGRKCGKQGSDC